MTDTYGDGIGLVVRPEVPTSDDSKTYRGERREKVVRTIVSGSVVTVIMREDIVPEDPLLNMMRAAAYPYQIGGGPESVFPVPPVSRKIKDVLIKTRLVI